MFRRLRSLCVFLLLLVPLVAGGDARPQTSGGYGRPNAGSSAGYAAQPRRPSVDSSGGYRRPSTAGGYSAYSGATGGGDQGISRRSSAEALRGYQAQQARPPAAGGAWGTSTGGQYGASQYLGGDRRPSSYLGGAGSGWQGDRRPPPSAYGPAYAASDQRFGVWSGLFLLGMLNSLSRPDSAAFFRDNRDDPGYRQWRASMDQAAAQDPAVRNRLAALDQTIAQAQSTPGKPPAIGQDAASRVPSGTSVPASGSSSLLVFIFVAVGILLFALLFWMRRRSATPAAGQPPALAGSKETRFRVGMTLPYDPSPFLLATGATKVQAPDSAGGMLSVEAVGVLMDGTIPLNRLYLPGGAAFLQLHLGSDGKPDECRYFSRLDNITPASQQEWGVWLDPAQGLIGWPQFQTKDGRLYDRVWAPGASRIAPRALAETIRDLRGSRSLKLQSMLYGTSSGAGALAPPTEYILVSAIDAGDQAWVEIHAGIDINPAAITLPAVALT